MNARPSAPLRRALVAACLIAAGAPAAPALQQANADEGPPAAQNAVDAEQLDEIRLREVHFEIAGRTVHVERVDAEKDELVVQFHDQPGSRARVPMDEVPRDTHYRLREAQLDPDDADDWKRLAQVARDLGLQLRRYEALQNAKQAMDGAPDEEFEKRLAAARESIASHRVMRARQRWDDGERLMAIEMLEDTAERFAGADAAQRAEQLAQDWQQRIPERDPGDGYVGSPPVDRIQETEDAELVGAEDLDVPGDDIGADGDAAASRDLPDDPRLREATVALAAGRERLLKAARIQDNTESRALLQQAIESLNQAAERLGGVRDRDVEVAKTGAEGDETPGASTRARLKRRTRDALVEAHVDLGYLQLLLGDQHSAYEHATTAATLDPENPIVSDLRNAVQEEDDVVVPLDELGG